MQQSIIEFDPIEVASSFILVVDHKKAVEVKIFVQTFDPKSILTTNLKVLYINDQR